MRFPTLQEALVITLVRLVEIAIAFWLGYMYGTNI